VNVLLVANPRSGRNRGARAAAEAVGVFTAAGWDVTQRATERPGDAARLAREAAGEGFDIVLACGGDGTLSQVLTGLLDTGVPAGIVPAGTGNDFARTLGLSRCPAEAAKQVVAGCAAHVDLLEINDGALWSVNVIGVGFDAAVSVRINRRTRLTGGALAYLAAVFQELFGYRPIEVRLRVDGERWEGRAMLVAIANAQSYGGGMRIAPAARVDDGLLDVVLVQHLGRAEFLWSLPRVFHGSHTTHPAVRTWTGREATVETTAPSPVLVDGDVQCETPVEVRIAPARALLWAPAHWPTTA
jgi:diacylglycerol kinase (ATP)